MQPDNSVFVCLPRPWRSESVGVTPNQYARFMGPATESAPNGALLSASKIRERGWTDSLVRRFLDPPDTTAPNPIYRSAARVRLYDLTRVLKVEASPEWQAAKVVASRRSVASSRASTRRALDVVERAGQFEVTLPVLRDETLFRRAVDHRNELRNNRDGFEHATMESVDESTLRRWGVNYLRHVLTEYDSQIGRFAGKPGVRSVEAITRQVIYGTIAATYPGLAEECRRQQAERANHY